MQGRARKWAGKCREESEKGWENAVKSRRRGRRMRGRVGKGVGKCRKESEKGHDNAGEE